MKSFDEMADDFVRRELPNVLRVCEAGRLRMAYLEGLNAGIKFCADTIEPLEEKGL